jgi:nucleotide-binding universal stress UspA family protein
MFAPSPVRIDRVLCPTDLSPLSWSALGLALDVARSQQAEILLVHVVAGPAHADAAGDPRVGLARLVSRARAAGVRASGLVLHGDVVARILERAAAWPADLVVMGTHGQRGGHDWALGSVTERVLRRTACPVLMTASGGAHGFAWRTPLRRILCPSDLSEASQRAFEYGALLAGAFSAAITPLHVLEWFPGRGDVPHLNVPEYHMDLSQDARDALLRSIPGSARPFCGGEAVVALGRPHREILRVAVERDVDLIVLGVHDQRALDRTLCGSTVCHVVRETCCPVLAVRGGKAAARGPAAPAARHRRAS